MSGKASYNIGDMPGEVMHCRAFGHSWSNPHRTAFGGKGRKAGYACTMICAVCDTEKHFTLSRRGELSAPRYIYPDNYLAKFFIGPQERGAFRLEAVGLSGDDAFVDPPKHLRSIEGGKAG